MDASLARRPPCPRSASWASPPLRSPPCSRSTTRSCASTVPIASLPTACASPYRASGPIFVRRGARQAVLHPGALPPYVTRRPISLRAYDATDMMVDAGLADGHQPLRDEIERLLRDARVRYIHLHNARRGCYSCKVERVLAAA